MATLEQYADDRPPYEQQPGESATAYQAFSEYARMPYANRDEAGRPGARSIAIAADTLGKSLSLLKRWSMDWRWVERVEAYDVAQRAAEMEAVRLAQKDAAVRVAQRRVQLQDESWDLFEAARARVAESLAFPFFHEEEEVLEDGPNGPSIVIHRHPLKDVTPSSIATLARAALALGLVATDSGEGALDGLLSKIDPEHLSTEQLQALSNGADPLTVLFAGTRTEAEGEGGTGTSEAAGRRA